MARFIGEYRRRSGFATLTAMFIRHCLVYERCGGVHTPSGLGDFFARPRPLY